MCGSVAKMKKHLVVGFGGVFTESLETMGFCEPSSSAILGHQAFEHSDCSVKGHQIPCLTECQKRPLRPIKLDDELAK